MKDHEIAQLVNHLKEVAVQYGGSQQLRERLSDVVCAAIEADRQRRGEPVGWHTEDHLTDKSATTYDPVVAERWLAKGWPVTSLYAAPQPAEPTQHPSYDRDCCHGHNPEPECKCAAHDAQPAEPAKVPSDDDLFAIHGEYFPVMMMGHENYLRFARALLARYGEKPARPMDTSQPPMDIAYGHKAQPAASLEPVLWQGRYAGSTYWHTMTAKPDPAWWSEIRGLAPVAAQPSAPEHLIDRLRKHCEDKANTAFARSTMKEALQYMSSPLVDGQP